MKFKKEDTLQIKGIAIIMLVIYHCFSNKDRLMGYPVKFMLPKHLAFYYAESMNICVGMFAFLSAFGLTIIYTKKREQGSWNTLLMNNFVKQRYVGLLASFLVPFLLCDIITYFYNGLTVYGVGVNAVLNFITDMFGFAGLLGTPMPIGTWWYLSLAILIILLVPIVVELRERSDVMVWVLFLVLPLLWLDKLTNMTRWLLCIPLGVYFAQDHVMERLKAKSYVKSPIVNKVLKFIVMTVILYVLVHLRKEEWMEKYAYYVISSVLPVYVVYYSYEFLVDLPIIKVVLSFLGNHSANIFYMHTFIRGVWLIDVTYSFKYSVYIFLFVMVATLGLSFIVEGIKKLTSYDAKVKQVSKWIVKA